MRRSDSGSVSQRRGEALPARVGPRSFCLGRDGGWGVAFLSTQHAAICIGGLGKCASPSSLRAPLPAGHRSNACRVQGLARRHSSHFARLREGLGGVTQVSISFRPWCLRRKRSHSARPPGAHRPPAGMPCVVGILADNGVRGNRPLPLGVDGPAVGQNRVQPLLASHLSGRLGRRHSRAVYCHRSRSILRKATRPVIVGVLSPFSETPLQVRFPGQGRKRIACRNLL
jgi:hypothetical protein